ncbi:MAG: tetratricopeptide repeat protein [Terrimicrobiaceae bacterium]
MATEQPLPADERIYTDESFGVELFWEKNKTAILLGIAAIIALALAVGIWVYRQHAVAEASQAAFAVAAGPDAWRELIAKYPASQPAAAARLMLAESLRESGDLKGSTEAYQEFVRDVPQTHPLHGLALLGLAQNASASGDQAGSLEKLKEADASSSTIAAELARLLEGRQLSEAGQHKEARAVYESIPTEFPNSLAARIALSQLEQIAIIDPNPSKKN